MDATDMKFFASHLADEMRLSEADQRSRDRLMLAGQILAAMWAHPSTDWSENGRTPKERSLLAFEEADALLSEHERHWEVK